ncbi:hypothetical protein JOL62DRAFT_346788 [Phyllosticta paracitricarpa]|uniref:Secreted protein n=2 Tax=Phyllosticta TaxID=121621 RepID=A0ABR1MMA2_9PEZI
MHGWLLCLMVESWTAWVPTYLHAWTDCSALLCFVLHCSALHCFALHCLFIEYTGRTEHGTMGLAALEKRTKDNETESKNEAIGERQKPRHQHSTVPKVFSIINNIWWTIWLPHATPCGIKQGGRAMRNSGYVRQSGSVGGARCAAVLCYYFYN